MAASIILAVDFSTSPSPRRAWIEIFVLNAINEHKLRSPSPRRAWIEIVIIVAVIAPTSVALPTEGVD